MCALACMLLMQLPRVAACDPLSCSCPSCLAGDALRAKEIWDLLQHHCTTQNIYLHSLGQQNDSEAKHVQADYKSCRGYHSNNGFYTIFRKIWTISDQLQKSCYPWPGSEKSSMHTSRRLLVPSTGACTPRLSLEYVIKKPVMLRLEGQRQGDLLLPRSLLDPRARQAQVNWSVQNVARGSGRRLRVG